MVSLHWRLYSSHYTVSELNTVSGLYSTDPFSALHFPRALLIMQSHNSLHPRACQEAHRGVITKRPALLLYMIKSKNKHDRRALIGDLYSLAMQTPQAQEKTYVSLLTLRNKRGPVRG